MDDKPSVELKPRGEGDNSIRHHPDKPRGAKTPSAPTPTASQPDIANVRNELRTTAEPQAPRTVPITSRMPDSQQPHPRHPSRLERFSQRVLLPLGLMGILTGGAAATVDQINKNNAGNSGYRPNQPGETQSTAEPTEYHQNSWADATRDRIKGEAPLQEGEEHIDQLVIRNRGQEYLPKGTVHVRDGYPGTYTGNDIVKIAGDIKVGSVINNAIKVVDGKLGQNPAIWYAFRLGDANGTVMDDQGKPIEGNPDMILTVAGPYAHALPPQP